MESPHFFVDRSLGRRRVPELLRADGWDLITLAERYGIPDDERVLDTEWLSLAGAQGWPVLMKDERIRYRSGEREALVNSEVVAFCLSSGNLDAQRMAECFMHHKSAIWEPALLGPALFVVTSRSMRQIDL